MRSHPPACSGLPWRGIPKCGATRRSPELPGTDFPVHRCLKPAPLCYPIPEEEMPLSEDEKVRRATLAATAAEEGREDDEENQDA